ncbi:MULTISPECIES: tRNA-guanine transglycosylase DpdA [Micromonospora]|uniref:tRNA-guanine transglycosylase DpdA n=1 Tax=Micromonospora TaxID=1873 RepID=UPI001B3675DB|nr:MULTISPECIES: tRNA-guanine transglycosylase DpdA [Micromonospora]MBQ1066953.1 queuine/other tRNA-ribosyltransferase [Micromonospora sp. D75]WDP99407.1 tRNA-guanine transglycosylase DpdA [Micromonospora chalcea]
MKFFFPDSQDQVDPTFDFLTEERDPFRVRQRDDLYAHEVLKPPPFNGLLVSKAIVDGTVGTSTGKYTLPQRHRLYRQGAREFFRLDNGSAPLKIMGDCGAFSYVGEDYPPYTVEEVVSFYEGCGFNYGISVDHVIFQYEPKVLRTDEAAKEWVRRQQITLDLAAEFWQRCSASDVHFTPLGVTQGWSPESYADAVVELQRIGYRRIAVGGMVPLKTKEILACLRAIDDVRLPDTQLHLLGISRVDEIPTFAGHGVTSFDSTSPFRQAFKDDRDNYYALDRTFVALRVPQVDGNAKLKARIRSGEISQRQAMLLERAALARLREFDRGEIPVEAALEALDAYSAVWDGKANRSSQYRDTLENRPWQECDCSICKKVGIETVIFRGAERNKRRGFHNLHVFGQRLRRHLGDDDHD